MRAPGSGLRPQCECQLQTTVLIVGQQLDDIPTEDGGLDEPHASLYANGVQPTTSMVIEAGHVGRAV